MTLFIVMVCYAGDIPESLLNNDNAQVYFGEISDIDDESITVIQRQNVKGNFSEGSEQVYEDYLFEDPIIGKTYLCGFLDEQNPLYIWEVSSFDLNELEIIDESKEFEMTKRMQKYLNDGMFTEKEQERLVNLAINNTAEMINSVSETSAMPIETTAADITYNNSDDDFNSARKISIVAVMGLLTIVITGGYIFIKKKR